MKIGFYEGNIKNTKKAQLITIAEFFNYVMYEKFKPLADKIAAITDKKTRQEEKAKLLPYVTISGVFSVRSEAGILEHSGLIAIDVDGVSDLAETKGLIAKDPYTFAVFKSVSGKGLCVVIKISQSADAHKDHFRWIEQYYYDQFNLTIDSSCKDVSRPRYVSSDKNIVINENSKRAGKKKLPKSKPKKISWIATEDQMHRIVTEIHSNQINIADSYQDYLACAFSIADGYGEAGRDYFHAVASVSDKYDFNQADKKYSNAVNTGRGAYKIGTFFYMAKNAGVELRSREETTAYAIATAAKRSKSNVEGAVATAEAAGIDPVLTEQVAKKVFERNDIDLSNPNESVIESIAATIRMNCNLLRNEITHIVENNGKDIDGVFLDSIYLKAKVEIGNGVTKGDVKAIINSDMVDSYHPILDWVKAHRHLPNKPEVIDDFISALPFEDPRAAMFVRHWLLGLPATVKGDVVRLVLCLIGTQRTGKTYWFRHFLPKSLKKYYAESSLLKDGDDAMTMGANLVVMDDELGGKSKRDTQKFKELTSKDIFSLRLPYGETIIKIKRLALLCGTTNDFQIISDTTGNTRMLPVEFNKKYNFEKYNSVDKDQLFMEIWRAHENGESWQLSEAADAALEDMNSAYSVADFEGELIDTFLDKPTNSIAGKFMSTTEIKIYLERASGQKIISINKLGAALRKRFDQEVKKVAGTTKRGYRCVTLESGVNYTDNQQVTGGPPF